MKVKTVACLLFFLNTLLFATYYSISKEALGRIDPIVFSFFEMVVLVPVALCILALSWSQMTKEVVKRGILLGSWLCLALFTIAIALKYTTATATAFFPSLNGLLAALIAWGLLKQPVKKVTWFAGSISVVGTVLLISYSPMGGWRGTLIAFLGGIFFTCYVFLSDSEQKEHIAPWPLFGVELLTMAGWASLIVLLFGNWQAVHPLFPKDTLIILYIAGATTFLPVLITVLMQKYISPVTVSFIYILEPVLGALIANMYLHEALPLQGYLGGGLVIGGTIINTWGMSRRHSSTTAKSRSKLAIIRHKLVPSSPVEIGILLPVLSIEAVLLYHFVGFPPAEWLLLYRITPGLPLLVQQGQGMIILFLCIRALAWLLIWLTVIIQGVLTAYGAILSLFSSRPRHAPTLSPSRPSSTYSQLRRQTPTTAPLRPTSIHHRQVRVGADLSELTANSLAHPGGNVAHPSRITPVPQE